MTFEDTLIGGKASRFPATRWSAIVAAKSSDNEARRQGLQVIIEIYWKPVYKTIRIKWHKSNEDAKDLTQAFFTAAIEKDFFKKFDPDKAKFRTFLRTCLHGFLTNEHKASQRLKRGGDQQILSLDFATAERELSGHEPAHDKTPDDFFDKEWTRSLYSSTVEALREQLKSQNKSVYFQIFEKYDLAENARPTYEELATEFALPETKITNYLAFARRSFRSILLERLRSVTMTEAEFQQEARALLGIQA